MGNRIKELFKNKDKILSVYCTAGFPNLNSTGEVLQEMQAAGIDMIELGMPYSDPLADGPTIQQSSSRALENGMNLNLLFEQIKAVRAQLTIPLILMGYYNQILQYGPRSFFEKCVDLGVEGLILPDLPLEEYERDYQSFFVENDLGISFLITPQTSPARIAKIDQLSRGFVYVVSNSATTGSKDGFSPEQELYFERISKLKLQNPILVGFGVHNFNTFSTVCQYAKGAIVGSAFIRVLEEGGDLKQSVQTFVEQLKGGLLTTNN